MFVCWVLLSVVACPAILPLRLRSLWRSIRRQSLYLLRCFPVLDMRIHHICLILPKFSWYSIICFHPFWARIVEITCVRVHSTYIRKNLHLDTIDNYSQMPFRHRGHVRGYCLVFFDHDIQHLRHSLWFLQVIWIISLCSKHTGQSPFTSKNSIFPIIIAQSTQRSPWVFRRCWGRFSLQNL